MWDSIIKSVIFLIGYPLALTIFVLIVIMMSRKGSEASYHKMKFEGWT